MMNRRGFLKALGAVTAIAVTGITKGSTSEALTAPAKPEREIQTRGNGYNIWNDSFYEWCERKFPNKSHTPKVYSSRIAPRIKPKQGSTKYGYSGYLKQSRSSRRHDRH